MNQDIVKLSKRYNPVSAVVQRTIKRNAYLTGSRVFGGYTDISDWDYILPVGVYEFGKLLDEGGFYLGGDYNDDNYDYQSIYVKADGGEIWNILCMSNIQAYRTWVRATETLQKLISIDPLIERKVLNKDLRVDMFECLKKIVGYIDKKPSVMISPFRKKYDKVKDLDRN